jgi:hypothetical protein
MLPVVFKFFKPKNIQESNKLARLSTCFVSMGKCQVDSFNKPIEKIRVKSFRKGISSIFSLYDTVTKEILG